jgi:AcrR family transcriptional regulator
MLHDMTINPNRFIEVSKPDAAINEKPRMDGRNQRAEKNRQLVAEAFLKLLVDGESNPTAQMISERSGVSTSTLFRLYEDLEALHVAVLTERVQQAREYFVDVPIQLPLNERVRQLVKLRSSYYEKIGNVRRYAVARRSVSKVVDRVLRRNEKRLYSQIQRLFAAEISELEQASDVLLGIDNITSWETWDRLRTVQKLSVKRAKVVVETTLMRLL